MSASAGGARPMLRSAAMLGLATGTIVGIGGRSRTWFMNDFTYAKYHFGVFAHMAAAAGLFHIEKMHPKVANPTVALFGCAVILTSLPAYYEGIKEIRNQPIEPLDSRGMARKLGFYLLCTGYFFIFCSNRGAIPWLNIKL